MAKFLGQHFLKNTAAVRKIIVALDIHADETIVEIGPGHGELTIPLMEATKKAKAKIITIEKDKKLADDLSAKIKQLGYGDEIEVVSGDALVFLKNAPKRFKLVGNLPYYITGHLLRIMSELQPSPERAVLMLQREVADRICASPPKMNRLAASVQFWAETKIITRLSKTDFSPPPEVESAVIEISARNPVPKDGDRYYSAVRALFAQPRKTILNNLSAAVDGKKADLVGLLGSIGIKPEMRPQNLTIDDIRAIAENVWIS